MSNDFQINTQIQTGAFNNSINEFNKVFSKANNNAVNNTTDGTNFDEIFNSIAKNPLQGSAQYNSYGALDLKANSKKQISPLQQTIGTIGNGIMNGINELNAINKQSEDDLETFASGGDISVHDVMISAEKSSLAMGMAIQLRNQAVNAYNEFKNMSM